MAKERTSVRMQAQIRRMLEQGYSRRAIARVLRISRKTIRKFAARPAESPDSPAWMQAVDWAYVQREVYGRGTTIKQVHRDVAPDVPYVRFWRALRERVPRQASAHDVTIRLQHQPGERTQIDFCDGVPLTDPTTGKTTPTQLFCGVLPFSAYTFGEFVLDQKLATFIGLHQRMFAYFGGVTPYVVVDNLKSGVHRADLYDPDVNPTYCDFANALGFAVLPARPAKARDKAAGESGIGVIQRGFFQEVRDRPFYSLADLNRAFREYLERLNHAVMKDYGVSRAQRFADEQPRLRPLPAAPFELSEWRSAKVHPDCHIQVEKNFYSVPFVYVGQTVRVRRTDKLIEVFHEDGQALAAHPRLTGVGQFSTFDAHYPEAKLSVARFEVRHATEQATRLGPHVEELVAALLSGEHPLRHLRRVQGILRLSRTYPLTPEAVDHACQQALLFKKPRLAYIKACALFFVTHGHRPQLLPPTRQPEAMHLHHLGARLEPDPTSTDEEEVL
jgi:transposase